ncbi:hypothetical protein MMC25_005488 [Agyrium rufum]|nr:hypothetical protein [Agyrium rufum]
MASTGYRTTILVTAATVGTLVTGFLAQHIYRAFGANHVFYVLAYAVYFDHKRRTDVNFRKNLKREARRTARQAREEADAAGKERAQAVKAAMKQAEEDGFPTNVEEKEVFFMQEVGEGERMCQDGTDPVTAALAFYKALKVYPQPSDLINIYDKTVPKPVLDILAEMIAEDPAIKLSAFGGNGGPGSSGGRSSSPGSSAGIDD